MVNILPNHAALAELVTGARGKFRGTVDGVRRIINDLYTGRDPASGGAELPPEGIPWNTISDPERLGQSWSYPQIGVNLMQSRTRQLVTELIPAVPVFHSEALVAQASKLVEDQNQLSLWAARHGGLKKTFRKSALHGLFGPHFGIKVLLNRKHPHLERRVQTIPIPASHCGYEPHHRRFSWHTYQTAWENIPPARQSLAIEDAVRTPTPQPWDIVTVTEVYHDKIMHKGPAGCSVSWFIDVPKTPSKEHASNAGEPWDSKVDHSLPLGRYTGTERLDICPLVIEAFLDPAPGEDIPPAEVASWVPIIRSIHADIKQIEEEVGSINNIVLVDKESIGDDEIARIQNNPAGHTLYIKVKTGDETGFDRANGVSHKMRPVERNSALGETISALQTHLELFDEVIGASSLDRGVAAHPRKSAKEAAMLDSASNRRTRDRLNVIADAMAQVAQVIFHIQHKAYGKTLKIPLGGGITQSVTVPDPRTARMAFRVDAVELGNLSKQGQIETHAASVTLLTNIRQQAPELIQGQVIVREAQRYLRALGNYEAADALRVPASATGPDQRLRDFLYQRTPEIVVLETDDHAAFLQFYVAELDAIGSGGNIPIMPLQTAIAQHQQFANEQAPAPVQQAAAAPVPGFNPGGQLDNQAEASEIPLDQIPSLTSFL